MILKNLALLLAKPMETVQKLKQTETCGLNDE